MDADLHWVLAILECNYEVKDRGRLGDGAKDKKEIDMLGRMIRIEKEGITWEGDTRHLAILDEHFGMKGVPKILTKNLYGENEGNQDMEDSEGEELTGPEAKAYRMVAARLNYMAQDDPWLQYPAKELCRSMAKPTRGGFARAKRVMRFLKGTGSQRCSTAGRTAGTRARRSCT